MTIEVGLEYASRCWITGKIQHSRRQARKTKRRHQARGDRDIRVYRCRHCGKCHVGHLSEEFSGSPPRS